MMKLPRAFAALVASFLISMPLFAHAAFPDKPIKLMGGFRLGGLPDTYARLP